MGPYSSVGAYLSETPLWVGAYWREGGAYSRGITQRRGLNRVFAVV